MVKRMCCLYESAFCVSRLGVDARFQESLWVEASEVLILVVKKSWQALASIPNTVTYGWCV